MDGASVSGEVVTAGTALAGLILIYIGNLATAFEGRTPGGERNAVRLKFLGRAWLAFVGFAFALLSSVLAIIGKWIGSGCASNVSVWSLLVAFVAATFATIQTIREMH
jgi:hypothetical protein